MLGFGELVKLLGQAGKMREHLGQAQARARERMVEAEAGAGLVRAKANGVGEIVEVRIESEAAKDMEALPALIVAAVNLALKRSREAMAEEFRGALGGMDLPPGLLGGQTGP